MWQPRSPVLTVRSGEHFEQADMNWDKHLIFAGSVAEPLAVTQGHSAADFGIPIHPMENKCLQHQLGVGQVPGTILLKGFKEFGIEPIGSLAGQGPVGALGVLYWFVSFGHKSQSLHVHPAAGKRYIRCVPLM